MLYCAEVMSHMVKQAHDIAPLEILDMRHIISQFADDTQLFSKAEEQSVKCIASTFEEVRQNIGFTINYDKTTITMLGGSHELNVDHPLCGRTHPQTCLG